MGWLVYVIGFILVYLMCKYIRKKSDSNNWEDIIITLVLSVCSWAGVLLVTLVGIGFYVKYIIENKNPPKWL